MTSIRGTTVKTLKFERFDTDHVMNTSVSLGWVFRDDAIVWNRRANVLNHMIPKMPLPNDFARSWTSWHDFNNLSWPNLKNVDCLRCLLPKTVLLMESIDVLSHLY